MYLIDVVDECDIGGDEVFEEIVLVIPPAHEDLGNRVSVDHHLVEVPCTEHSVDHSIEHSIEHSIRHSVDF